MAPESHMAAEIWSLTVEIFHLLTGETQPGDHVTIKISSPPSLSPDKHALKKILEVTRKITDLLIGEMTFPQEMCLAENEAKPVTSKAGSSGAGWSDVKMKPPRKTPVRSMLGKYGDGSAAGETGASRQEKYMKKESSPVIGADPKDKVVKCEKTEEEKVRIKEEEIPLEISPDGRYIWNETEEDAAILSHGEMENDITAESTGSPTNPNPPPALPTADMSLDPSTYSAIFPHHHLHHTGENPYSCSECRRDFSTKSNLARHKKVHKGEKPFQCPKCEKCYSHKSALITHQRLHLGIKPFVCLECGKTFTQKSELVVHERVHTGERPYGCSECGKCFSNHSNLARHKRLHNGDRPEKVYKGEKKYFCSKCEKSFSQKSTLITHEKLHLGEKPYSCSECGKDFSQKYELVQHKRVHSGEKPFTCNECGRTFSSNSNLCRHIRLHRGVRPYACSICGKSFSQKSVLMAHETLHTGGEIAMFVL